MISHVKTEVFVATGGLYDSLVHVLRECSYGILTSQVNEGRHLELLGVIVGLVNIVRAVPVAINIIEVDTFIAFVLVECLLIEYARLIDLVRELAEALKRFLFVAVHVCPLDEPRIIRVVWQPRDKLLRRQVVLILLLCLVCDENALSPRIQLRCERLGKSLRMKLDLGEAETDRDQKGRNEHLKARGQKMSTVELALAAEHGFYLCAAATTLAVVLDIGLLTIRKI